MLCRICAQKAPCKTHDAFGPLKQSDRFAQDSRLHYMVFLHQPDGSRCDLLAADHNGDGRQAGEAVGIARPTPPALLGTAACRICRRCAIRVHPARRFCKRARKVPASSRSKSCDLCAVIRAFAALCSVIPSVSIQRDLGRFAFQCQRPRAVFCRSGFVQLPAQAVKYPQHCKSRGG